MASKRSLLCYYFVRLRTSKTDKHDLLPSNLITNNLIKERLYEYQKIGWTDFAIVSWFPRFKEDLEGWLWLWGQGLGPFSPHPKSQARTLQHPCPPTHSHPGGSQVPQAATPAWLAFPKAALKRLVPFREFQRATGSYWGAPARSWWLFSAQNRSEGNRKGSTRFPSRD